MQHLWEDICSEENLRQAWMRVKTNMGSPGVDRVSIEEFESNLSNNLELLRSLLKQNTYHPLPMLVIQVKKGDGGKRTLNIPTIRDRIVQEACLLILQPLFDKGFLNCSYGYRPGMSAQGAIARIERNIRRGRNWIIDADIENFFDSVDRKLLMQFVSEKISNPRVIRIINECIGKEGEKGLPQGSPLSPLLSNIYLHRLDERMIRGQWNYVRFADDFVTLCTSKDEATKAIDIAREVIEGQLLLAINESKTRICRAEEGFVFLGYRFTDKGKSPAGKAVDNLKRKVQNEILASKTRPQGDLQNRLRRIIRGWQNYFKLESQDRAELMNHLDSIISSQADSVPAHVLKAALCVEGGEREKAEEVMAHGTELPSEDPELRYQWGVLYDTLNHPIEARDEYYSALRAGPDHKEASYSLGLNHLQHGDVEKSIRFLQKAVQLDPGFAEAHFALGTALESWGLRGTARKAYRRAREINPELKLPKPSLEEKKPKEPVPHSEGDEQLFLRLFSGREGVFARQWVNSSGRYGYTPVSEPLSEKHVEAHLAGKETLGLYMMRSDNTVKLGIIDIDITKATIREIGADQDTLAGWDRIVGQDVNNLLQVLKDIDIPAYVENSGWKGRHCWLFFAEPVRASHVRKFLKAVCQAAGEPPAGLHREIFPKQDRVSKEGLGCLIKLPLGVHKVTERRCLFVDAAGEPLEDQFGLLSQVKFVSNAALREARTRLQHRGEPEIQADIDDAPVKMVLEKCNVLRYLSNKAENSGDLTHYERIVILCTLGHLGAAGKHYIHNIIGKSPNYSRHVTEKWIRRLKPFPISCPKIREMLCDITPSVGCYCEFPKRKNSYPTPILHADPDAIIKLREEMATASSDKIAEDRKAEIMAEKQEEALAASEKRQDQPANLSIDEPLRDYLELKRSLREINLKINQTEEQLKSIFESTGREKIQTYMGILTRVERDGRETWIIEI